jgi:quercetin dioxygenase-like cupin family protein
MTRISLICGLFLVALLPLAATAADEHRAVLPDQLKWGAPATLPKGAEAAVVFGDPSKEGYYVVRLRFPAGFKIPAHFHPNDENVTVLSGTLNIGLGDKLDETKGEAVTAGGFIQQKAGMNHYAWFTEDTVIQMNSIGPSGITYVNPADDPRKTQ